MAGETFHNSRTYNKKELIPSIKLSIKLWLVTPQQYNLFSVITIRTHQDFKIDFKELKRYDLDVPLFLCLFAKLSLEAHCHAFVTVEETKRQQGQSATPVSYRLLLLEKGTKMKIDNGCEIFLATETITIFVFYLPINNFYHIIHALITTRVDHCN